MDALNEEMAAARESAEQHDHRLGAFERMGDQVVATCPACGAQAILCCIEGVWSRSGATQEKLCGWLQGIKHGRPRRVDSAEVKSRLQQLADAASFQGRARVEAICLLALARIEELESRVTSRCRACLATGRSDRERR